jgi:ATP-dependent Lon protease
VLFIATANKYSQQFNPSIQNIQAPLLDRLELISIPGYSREEKVQIACSHLIPKLMGRHGLEEGKVEFEKQPEIISKIVVDYTQEAGVRQLERNIAALFRNAALKVVKEGNGAKIRFTLQTVLEILGAPKIHDSNPSIVTPGIARGLAWTQAGGKVLMVETVRMPGKGRIEVTGQLGDVMKESVKAALGFIKSSWKNLEKYIPIDE